MIKVNSRTCRAYAAMEGIHPSDVARLMLESAAEIGWWYEDWLPRIHMIEALMDAKDSRHLSHPIILWSMVGASSGLTCQPDVCGVIASLPMPPVVEKTRGVKTPCSTSLILCPY